MTVRQWVWPAGVRFHTRRDESLSDLLDRLFADLDPEVRARVEAESVQVEGPEVAA